jgi:aryl-alcohol dehydrogenase-like predicted oxidoreductase
MGSLVDQGFTTFDAADIYGPAEALIGEFVGRRRSQNLDTDHLQFLTKWVPRPGQEITKDLVRAALDRSRTQMKTSCLDVVQFHWWGMCLLFFIIPLKKVLFALTRAILDGPYIYIYI